MCSREVILWLLHMFLSLMSKPSPYTWNICLREQDPAMSKIIKELVLPNAPKARLLLLLI